MDANGVHVVRFVVKQAVVEEEEEEEEVLQDLSTALALDGASRGSSNPFWRYSFTSGPEEPPPPPPPPPPPV